MNWSHYFEGLIVCIALATLVWVISVFQRNVSIVDSWWSVLLVSAALVYIDGAGQREWLVLSLLILWALRLSLHITIRSWGEQEDHRYQAIRKKYSPRFTFKSLFIIFIFQAILAWILSLPLFFILSNPSELNLVALIATVIVFFGIVFESIADWQLQCFKSNPANQGKVMDQGLWYFSRHPNYFGEALVWWGFSLFAIGQGFWWSIISPLLLSYLLLKFSGVNLIELSISERRPGYRDYIDSTSAFIPGPKKNSSKNHMKGEQS